jgi:hypothetical protein
MRKYRPDGFFVLDGLPVTIILNDGRRTATAVLLSTLKHLPEFREGMGHRERTV